MARLLHTALALTTFLLLGCTLVSSQTTIRLPDILIMEGTAANSLILDELSTYASNRIIIILEGDDNRRIFDMYFSHTGGRVTTAQTIDRDDIALQLQQTHQPVSFNISIHLLDFTTIIETVSVILRIMDRNDNVPTFPIDTIFIIFIEELSGSIRRLPLAIDNDQGINTVHTYTLSPQNNEDGTFRLQIHLNDQGFISDLRLVQARTLDRERRSSYILSITATEGTSNPASDTLVVNITVQDVCGQPPQFMMSRYFAEVEENSLARPLILPNITAMDSNLNPVISYRIRDVCSRDAENTPPCVTMPLDESPFNLDRERGDLTITRELDREEFAQYIITISAEDDCSGTGTATVVVTVLNVNDTSPVNDDEHPVFLERQHTFTIDTSLRPGSEVGRVTARDEDEDPFNQTIYILESISSLFSIRNQSNGAITLESHLDGPGMFQLNVSAHKLGREDRKDTIAVTIFVIKVQPVGTISVTEVQPVGTISVTEVQPVGTISVTEVQPLGTISVTEVQPLDIPLIAGVAGGATVLLVLIAVVIAIIGCTYCCSKHYNQYNMKENLQQPESRKSQQGLSRVDG